MSKKGTYHEYPMGVFPFAIIVFLLGVALIALATGVGWVEFATLIGITAMIVGFTAIVWWYGAQKMPFGGWNLGSGPQASLVLFAVAFFSYVYIAPWIQTKIHFQILPLQFIGNQVVGGSIEVAIILTIMLLIVCGIFVSSRRLLSEL